MKELRERLEFLMDFENKLKAKGFELNESKKKEMSLLRKALFIK